MRWRGRACKRWISRSCAGRRRAYPGARPEAHRPHGRPGFAARRSGGGGVAGGAVGVEVAHHPAEGMRAIGAQMGKTRGIVRLAGGKVTRAGHVDPFGMERQHDRGFDLAAMDVDRLGLRRDPARRLPEPGPAGCDHEHLEPDAQFRGDDRHQGRVAAMGVEQHQLANAARAQVLRHADPSLDGLAIGERSGCPRCRCARSSSRPALPAGSSPAGRRAGRKPGAAQCHRQSACRFRKAGAARAVHARRAAEPRSSRTAFRARRKNQCPARRGGGAHGGFAFILTAAPLRIRDGLPALAAGLSHESYK